MRIWVDVESPLGTKVGMGPISTATDWQSEHRMDEAGSFSFRMPAEDYKANLLDHRRFVRCSGIVNDVVTEIGVGIVESVVIEDGDTPMLRVSGDDLMSELADISVHELVCATQTVSVPDYAKDYNHSDTSYADMTNALDENSGTNYAISLVTADYLYVGDTAVFDQVRLQVGSTVNSNTARLKAEYWNGSGWSSTTIVEDGTMNPDHETLGQTGTYDVRFERQEDWDTTTVDSDSAYWIRFSATKDLTASINIVDIWVIVETPTLTSISSIIACASAWSLDAGYYTETQTAVAMRFSGESVLTALKSVADRTGEHFRLGTGREIEWLQDDQTNCGVRAVRPNVAGDIYSDTNVCPISELSEDENGYELVTRVYPYGAGIGNARITLSQTTETPPAGYTLDKANNYLKHDAAETAYGQIEVVKAWKDVSSAYQAASQDVPASNELYKEAYQFLRKNHEPQKAYKFTLQASKQLLKTGDIISVNYQRVVGGYLAIDIDDDLYILSATAQIDNQGIFSQRLAASTIDAFPIDDARAIIERTQAFDAYQGHDMATTVDSVTYEVVQAGLSRIQAVFCIVGTVQVSATAAPSLIVGPDALTVTKVSAYCRTAPTGADIDFLVRYTRSGSPTTISSLTLVDGTNTIASGALTTALVEGDILDVEVTQVGSSVAGADMTVYLYTERGTQA